MENILLLYTRYSGYVDASFQKYANTFNARIHVVRYPVDGASPFQLTGNNQISLYNRSEYDYNKILELIKEHNIKVVLCAGWRDKEYLKVCRYVLREGGLTIGLVDNQWMGTLKQKVMAKTSFFFVKRFFKKLWVPGTYQFEYARRLGYARFDIMLNYYTANTELFKTTHRTSMPKKFIYVGRLLEIKGVHVLLAALKLVAADLQKAGWKFVVIGNGPHATEFEALANQYESIEYIPFLQQKELAERTMDGGVFVLPSNYDAWSVAVHEYACIGCPLLLSEAVGSRVQFLRQGFNGDIFVTGSPEDLVKKMKGFMEKSSGQLAEMGNRSSLLAGTINLDIWAYTLKNAINEFFAGTIYKPLKRTHYQ
ncbi:MAG: glycosyltransferase [Chitinophagaceae bacterium]|nr:glycosyltransferase [Chitinophagaceae bacterium]